MSRILATVLSLLLPCSIFLALGQDPDTTDALPKPPEGKVLKLAWHDEFDGTKLDQSKWIYRLEGKRRDGWWSRKAVSLDGKETWRTNAGGSICHVPQYTLLSDEIGKWGGDITKAKLPDKFLVDYVRVYDLVDKN
jgi:hypothetical protein